MALLAVVVTHMMDAAMAVVKALPQATDTGTLLAPGFEKYAIAGIIFAWCNNSLFTVLNYLRLRPILNKLHPTRSTVLACVVAASWALCTINNAMYVIMYTHAATMPYVEQTLPDVVYEYWVIYDCLVNTAISLQFLSLLQQMMYSPTPELQPYTSEVLVRIRWILFLECAAVISVNLMLLVRRALDPLQLLPYVVESFRLNLFAQFLVVLSRLLKSDPASNVGRLPTRSLQQRK
ncbi:hypothetical protein RI367_006435 [Sorochytrium milnesiophthora]